MTADLFSLTMAVALLAVASLDAKTYYVDGSFQREHSSGESWSSAFSSVQEAINAASATGGGEIWIKTGVYKPSGIWRAATFRLDSGIKLYGGFRGNETDLEQRNPKANRTVLSGDIGRIGFRDDNCRHIVTGASNSRLDGFIVMAGTADGDGEHGRGGALLLGREVKKFTVANCIFEKNSAHSGGAIHSLAHGVTLTNCTFFSNSADTGGAFAAGPRTRTRVVGSSFSSNYSKQSGGAVALDSDADAGFSGCSFLFNTSDGEGGAVAAATDRKGGIRLGFADCIFSRNSARENGGAAVYRGPFRPTMVKCSFLRNLSEEGAGTVANFGGATADLTDCTFSMNRGVPGMEDVWSDSASALAAKSGSPSPEKPKVKLAAAKPAPKPQPAPKKKRRLEDVSVHDRTGAKVKLRGVAGNGDLTVFVLGDLTDPGFISHYRGIEAAALDYAPKGVNFFYIYRYLAHPGNNGYIQPFILGERMRQTSDAANLLHTQVPWLCDAMDNHAARALERNGSNLVVVNRDGLEEYTGHIEDDRALRAALGKLAGETATPTTPHSIVPPDIKPVAMPKANVAKRIKTDPSREKFLPLRAVVLGSHSPFYVKMRVEASEGLLKTGSGRMILGFHIDPLYKLEWNNMGKTVAYAMKVPSGTAISPSISEAERVSLQATDSDPREFLLEARKWKVDEPVGITVDYSVRSFVSNRKHEVSQRYIIHLDPDRFGGVVMGRQIPMPAK